MNARLVQILRPHEWLILAGGALLLGAVYALLIQPSLESLAEIPRLERKMTLAEEGLARVTNTLQRVEQQIDEDSTALSDMGGAPPLASQKDLQIARLTALASNCNVTINQYVPIDIVDHADHRAFMVEFVGEGSFVDIQRLFNRIESQIDFVDVTHFAIRSANHNEVSDCLVTWSCRINGIRPELIPTESTANRSAQVPPVMEVARHGS